MAHLVVASCDSEEHMASIETPTLAKMGSEIALSVAMVVKVRALGGNSTYSTVREKIKGFRPGGHEGSDEQGSRRRLSCKSWKAWVGNPTLNQVQSCIGTKYMKLHRRTLQTCR